jgi:hypothetical protein
MELNEKSNQNTVLSEELFKDFYEAFGSSSLKLQGKILGELGDKQLDIYFKSIGFATTVIGAIGLIAGFGFTAFGYVQSVLLFFIGESLLLGALFYGLFWTQRKYQAEFNVLEQDRQKYLTFYEERNKKFIKLFENGLRSPHIINKKEFIDLNELDKKSIELFKNENPKVAPDIYSRIMYILMIFGSIILFSSFFIFDFVRFLFLCYL